MCHHAGSVISYLLKKNFNEEKLKCDDAALWKNTPGFNPQYQQKRNSGQSQLYVCVCAGWIPETVEEWKFLLHLLQSKSPRTATRESQNGSVSDGSSPVSMENVALLLAKSVGPDRAWSLLQECGVAPELSEKFTRTCDILRIAEKRQRALIQSMLEKCDRYLWSQQT
ncbi:Hermansky-Pudlak syndrome 5 protein-like [Fukomys damarensis]|uniref:Hermansky-Pudlak syndrome 5 protein-like n=1 Tax=Fukomys damarensis TaxID=885580 RepID=UPI0014550C64|nr:Hermansky-Pudlak syndrome 5 protein-like [Fukomys damarensis]